MESIVIYPKNEKQESLLKSLLKEMKVRFDVVERGDESLLTEEEFYKKIDKSLKQARAGKTMTLPKSRQNELLGL